LGYPPAGAELLTPYGGTAESPAQTAAEEPVTAEAPTAGPPPPGTGEEDLPRSLLAAARASARTGRSGRGQAQRRRSRYAAAAANAAAGSGGGFSGPAPDDRDPQAIGDTVERLVAERGWSDDASVGAVIGRWPDVVGEDVAAHCAPERFADGVLVVRADSTTWATQVRLLAPVLQRRLDEEVGAGVVVRLEVLGPGRPSWRKGSLSVPGRGPRDTYG
jgi:predicted nucleic acid-binding Zn ribbon protein